MSKHKKPLPEPGGRLTSSYSRLAKEFVKHGMEKNEAREFAHAIQDVTAMHQWGAISNDEMADLFYDIYDEIIDDYDIDMHDEDFYPTGGK